LGVPQGLCARPQVTGDLSIVPHEPFFDNAVFKAQTIRNRGKTNTAPSCRPKFPVTLMGGMARDAMGRMIAVYLIARPNNGLAYQSSVGKTVQGLERPRDHAFDASNITTHQMNGTILTIMGGDEANILFFPNPVRAPNDIVDDINIYVVKALHGLPAGTLWRKELSDISTIEA
jgi:hypothetical protein